MVMLSNSVIGWNENAPSNIVASGYPLGLVLGPILVVGLLLSTHAGPAALKPAAVPPLATHPRPPPLDPTSKPVSFWNR